MSLTVYNSLSEKKEPFIPIHDENVLLYVCGPTVYSDSHLGHAKTYVSFDVILRYLRYSGYKTFYVQNVTDVGHLVGDQDEGEDKILKKAKEVAKQPMAIVEEYMRRHFEAMDLLEVIRPDISPRATGHIIEQLEAIREMINRGDAYEQNGSVYFDVSRSKEYGKLSNRNQDEMMTGTRIEVRSEKRNPNDFALWKKAEPEHLMQWKDPWSGAGFPGWHTECMVMSTQYLGDSFDIHGGGMDLKFPHHECEIAQADSLNKPFAKYWLHSNMLTINSQKMAKSLGNFITLQEAFKTCDPLVIRYFIVASHYRSVVDFSDSAIQAAENSLQRLHQVTSLLRDRLPENAQPSHQSFQEYRKRFCNAMDDDFSTPQALAVLFELSREVNTMLNAGSPDIDAIVDAEHLFTTLGGQVLGLIPDNLRKQNTKDQNIDKVMGILIELRKQFRDKKDYANADFIRNQLKDAGVQLNDSRNATGWEWLD